MKRYEIQYKLIGDDKVYTTVIEAEQVEIPQLMWDTMLYLRSIYSSVLSTRPR